MSNKRDDESLEFCFSLDPRLAERTNTFRFTVQLTNPSPPPHRDTANGYASRQVSRSVITTCMPAAGNPNVNVGPNTEICVLGNATMFTSEFPDVVKGRIYHPPLASYDPKPPTDASSAVMVNIGGSSPNFTPPSFCGDVNFVFHPQFGNELRGAGHSTSGVANDLVLWSVKGSMIGGPHVVPFNGFTSPGSDCAGSGVQLATRNVPPMIAEEWPRKLFLSCASSTFGQKQIALIRQEPPHTGAVEWVACPKSSPDMQWKLWVSLHNGRPYAVAALHKVLGTRLETPLVWRAEAFDVAGKNEFVADSPDEVSHDMQRIVVSL